MSNRQPLREVVSQWLPPEDDSRAPSEEWRETWENASLRVVRSVKRKRKLKKKRGVEMYWSTSSNAWYWFVERKI